MRTVARVTAASHVLVVVGDAATAEALSVALDLAGCRTTTANGGAEAAPRLTERPFDLVVLDVLLPDLHLLRRPPGQAVAGMPAVLLLAEGELLGTMVPPDPRAAPDTGAARVTRLGEVVSRVRQLTGGDAPDPGGGAHGYADLVLDDLTCRAWRGRRVVELTPAEYRLLRCLLAHPDRVLSKEELGRRVWGEPPTDSAIGRLVSRLRRKVDVEEPALIHTRRGFGYWLGGPMRS
ncbi:response regulator transcription factor [Streptomyces sp. NPDC002920]